jgi:hypothetical protein
MLKAKDILKQGMGFGTLSILLQGLVIIAVELPQPYIWLEGPYSQPKTVTQVQRVSAYVRLGSSNLSAFLEDPRVSAAAQLGVLSHDLVLKEGKVSASAGTKVLLFATSADAKLGKILATGQHDLTDEELIAMLLEMLDEQ